MAHPPTAPPIMAPLFDEPPPPPPDEEEVAASKVSDLFEDRVNANLRAGVGIVGTGVVVTVVNGVVGTDDEVVVGADVLVLVNQEAAADEVGTTAATPGVQLKRPEESVLCTTQKLPVPHPTYV